VSGISPSAQAKSPLALAPKAPGQT
jgi:hypothetical protein